MKNLPKGGKMSPEAFNLDDTLNRSPLIWNQICLEEISFPEELYYDWLYFKYLWCPVCSSLTPIGYNNPEYDIPRRTCWHCGIAWAISPPKLLNWEDTIRINSTYIDSIPLEVSVQGKDVDGYHHPGFDIEIFQPFLPTTHPFYLFHPTPMIEIPRIEDKNIARKLRIASRLPRPKETQYNYSPPVGDLYGMRNSSTVQSSFCIEETMISLSEIFAKRMARLDKNRSPDFAISHYMWHLGDIENLDENLDLVVTSCPYCFSAVLCHRTYPYKSYCPFCFNKVHILATKICPSFEDYILSNRLKLLSGEYLSFLADNYQSWWRRIGNREENLLFNWDTAGYFRSHQPEDRKVSPGEAVTPICYSQARIGGDIDEPVCDADAPVISI
jgi:hypothetical protein